MIDCQCEPFQSCESCRVDLSKPGLAKKSKSAKTKTKAEKDHLNWVASQGCMIMGCLNPPCVHHIRECGEQRDDRRSIPLCWYHHQGPEGIHFLGKKVWVKKYGREIDMLKTLMDRKP